MNARTQAWETRRERYGHAGHAGYKLRPRRGPLESAALRLIVRLHEEEVLSEGQCCQALGIDRIEFREICDSFGAGATVGERIRAARQAAGQTREMLAGRIGLSRPQIANIEREMCGVSVAKLVEIAAALGVSPAALLPATPSEAAGPAIANLHRLDEPNV